LGDYSASERAELQSELEHSMSLTFVMGSNQNLPYNKLARYAVVISQIIVAQHSDLLLTNGLSDVSLY
jgi:hypothetical protein